MNRARAAFRAHPYISNVVGYTALFSCADLFQQRASRRRDRSAGVDWRQTARVATVGFCFHANFNYRWLRWLERMLPGGGVKAVTGKVVVDQLVAAPLTISAFYIGSFWNVTTAIMEGLSFLENKDNLFQDCKEKFWTSYKTGVVFWSTMQAVNFSLVPPMARTVFLGGVALVFTIFLCHLRQQDHKLE